MMKYYTIGESCEELGINRTTLERRYKRLKIRPKQGDIDHRERFLSEKDIEQLREKYATKEQRRQNAANQPQNNKAAMLEEIKKLRERVEALEQGVITKTHLMPFRRSRDDEDTESHITAPSSIASSDLPRRASQVYSRRLALPDGWASLDGFCKQHHIPHSTVDKAMATGRLPRPHRGDWKDGRAVVKNALDPEMQANILTVYGRPDDDTQE